MAQLCGIAFQTAQVGAIGYLKAQQFADEMRLPGSQGGIVHAIFESTLKLGFDDVGVVVLVDAEAQAEHIAQQGVGRRSGFLACAALEELRRWGALHGPLLEFVYQPGFADAGFTGDMDDDGMLLLFNLAIDLLQLLQLGVAPDHVGGNAFGVASLARLDERQRLDDLISLHRLGKALEIQGRQRMSLEQTAHVLVSIV